MRPDRVSLWFLESNALPSAYRLRYASGEKEVDTQKFINVSRKTRTVNRMNSSFPNRQSFSYPN